MSTHLILREMEGKKETALTFVRFVQMMMVLLGGGWLGKRQIKGFQSCNIKNSSGGDDGGQWHVPTICHLRNRQKLNSRVLF